METFQYAVENYCKFIQEVAKRGEPLVISCPLPTIRDGVAQGEVANLRREVKVNQRDRTDMTMKFNLAIEKFCSISGFSFINLDKESIDGSGLVKKSLLNSRPTDHHYHKRRYARLIDSRLEPFLTKP